MGGSIISMTRRFINLTAGATYAHYVKDGSPNLVIVRNPSTADRIYFGDDQGVSPTRYQSYADIGSSNFFTKLGALTEIFLFCAGNVNRVEVIEIEAVDPAMFMLQSGQLSVSNVNVVGTIGLKGAELHIDPVTKDLFVKLPAGSALLPTDLSIEAGTKYLNVNAKNINVDGDNDVQVDVKTTAGLKASDLNLDGEKDLQVDVKTTAGLKASDLNLDGTKDLQVDVKTTAGLKASELKIDTTTKELGVKQNPYNDSNSIGAAFSQDSTANAVNLLQLNAVAGKRNYIHYIEVQISGADAGADGTLTIWDGGYSGGTIILKEHIVSGTAKGSRFGVALKYPLPGAIGQEIDIRVTALGAGCISTINVGYFVGA